MPSIQVDKNDRTQQPGYWIDDFDMRRLIKYSEAIEAIREGWK